MAHANEDKKDRNQDNPYKKSVSKWVIGIAIAVILLVILLLVFNRRSTVVNPEGESDSHIGFVIIPSQEFKFS